MANIKLNPDDRKEIFTIRIKKRIKDQIKLIPNYNSIIEKLITDYLNKNKD